MSRYYKVDKLKFPSVTTIISDCTDKSGPLTQWAANMVVEYMKSALCADPDCPYIAQEIFDHLEKARFNFRNVSKDALDIGSEVHNAIELYLKDKICNVDTKDELLGMLSCEQANNSFSAFLEWEQEYNLKPIALEKTVYGNGWAGTLDFLGYMNGKLYVVDWKSSKAIYPEMRYQIAAYRSEAVKPFDSSMKPPEGCGILRLDKETGMPEFQDTSKSYKQDLTIFNAMVELYFARHPRIKKNAGR